MSNSKNNKINVLMFEPYPFNQTSGNWKTQNHIMHCVDDKKFKLVFMAPFKTEFTQKLQEDLIDTIILEPSRRINRYGGKCLKDNFVGKVLTIFDLIKYNGKLFKIFKSKNIHVLYCNCIRGVLTVCLAALLSRIPILWYIKGELQNVFLDTIGFIVSKRIVFISDSNKKDKYPMLVKYFFSKIRIVENGINPQMIDKAIKTNKSKLKEELCISSESPNLIYLGQIYAPKGIHYLIESIPIIKQQFKNVRLYVVGDHIIDAYEGYKHELLKIIERSNLSEQIVFTGWRYDALQIISIMDVLVHPSLTEGFPTVVLEGMALGKPVVATKIGGTRDIIKDGKNGFLVEPRDSKELAEKIIKLLNDKELANNIGKNARETVFSGYIIQDKIRELEQIWSDMAQRK